MLSETEIYLDLSGEVLSLMERVSNVWKCLACQYENTRKTNMFEHVEAKGRFHLIHGLYVVQCIKGGRGAYFQEKVGRILFFLIGPGLN